MSYYLLLFSLVFSSLSESRAKAGPSSTLDEPSLVEAVKKNWDSDYVSTCDLKNRSKALVLARALDERAADLRNLTLRQSQTQNTGYFQMGPIVFRDQKATGPVQQGWFSDPFGWEEAFQTYEKIRNTPVDENWAQLNRDVRAIILEDKKRLRSNINVELTHDSAGSLLKALSVAEECLQTLGCLSPQFDSYTVQFVQNNTIYRSFMAMIDRARDNRKKVSVLQFFRNRLKIDYDYYFGFVPASSLRRISATDFEFPLDAGKLRGHEASLEGVIKSLWNSDRYKLHIKWVNSSHLTDPNIYKIVVEPGNAGNPETDQKKHIIHLYQGNQVKRLAHEVGHAMGFPDHYFDAWNSQSCEYRIEIRSGDIMSEAHAGKALPEEWHTLDNYYPNAKVSGRR